MFWKWNKVRLAFFLPALLGFVVFLSGCTGKNEIEIRESPAGRGDSMTLASMAGSADSLIREAGAALPPDSVSEAEGKKQNVSGREAVGSTGQEKSGGNPAAARQNSAALQPADGGKVKIFVCGAVSQEGVYELDSASRVIDAVQAAGGFSRDADSQYVNQAAPVADGMKLRIPTKAETAKARAGKEKVSLAEDQTMNPAWQGAESAQLQTAGADGDRPQTAGESGGVVNLNTATKKELCTLPGIGEAKADAILAYRSANGSFSRIEDIKKIPGIKDKLFLKIKSKIRT